MDAISSCTAIGVLRIAGCKRVGDIGVARACGPEVEEEMRRLLGSGKSAATVLSGIRPPDHVMATLRFLRVLDLSECAITDFSLLCIGRHLPLLGALVLMNVSTVTDVGMVAMAKGCKRLRRLACTNNREVADRTLSALIDWCPKLAAVSPAPTGV